MTSPTIEYPVCDNCIMVAADMGVPDYDTQAELMQEMGSVLDDHICIVNEEPDLNETCLCGCQTSR